MPRILSWNVNGIRAVEKKGFADWIRTENPDILAIQETKASPHQLSQDLLSPLDASGKPYRAFWSSAKKAGYSGTALYTRQEPLEVRPLGIADFDDEGRTLIAEYPSFTLVNCYFPNSQEAGARLDYKLAFCQAIHELALGIVKKGRHLVLCGDYNIAHTEIDLANPKSNEGNPGFLPAERAWMSQYLESGFADPYRLAHPGEKGLYSWWSYRFHARDKNIGWRIDYHTVDQAFLSSIQSTSILSSVIGSDHCPVEIVIKE